jgi:hypothetical protein
MTPDGASHIDLEFKHRKLASMRSLRVTMSPAISSVTRRWATCSSPWSLKTAAPSGR